jgi:hypothetical protein
MTVTVTDAMIQAARAAGTALTGAATSDEVIRAMLEAALAAPKPIAVVRPRKAPKTQPALAARVAVARKKRLW